MSNDNTQEPAEPAPASAGSHGDERRAAFERWADVLGLRISNWSSGRYLDSATQWAWNGWSAATLTDAEREAIWTVAEAYAENDGDPECERIARIMQGLWQRTS
jgi:hypothetical protein